jgi:hypothetical protein
MVAAVCCRCDGSATESISIDMTGSRFTQFEDAVMGGFWEKLN